MRGSPGAAPDQAGQYQIPVSIKGGTYQALVDSGCNQTSIHQSLMQQRALDTSRKVKVRCVHGDVADYPLVPVSIKFRGKTHRMEVAVNSHLKHPLILGTDWPAFTQLLGIVCADVSWQTGRSQEAATAQAGEARQAIHRLPRRKREPARGLNLLSWMTFLWSSRGMRRSKTRLIGAAPLMGSFSSRTFPSPSPIFPL